MTTRSWILFGAMGVIWGVPYMFIKVAVEHMEPPVIVFGRSALAVVVLLGFAIRAQAIRPALVRWRPLLVFAGLEMALPWFLLTDAERHLPSGLTGLLIACVPIFGAVVGFVLGDRHALAPRRLIGIALGLAGVALLVGGDLAGSAPWWSVIEVLLVCVCYATAPFIAATALADVPAIGVVTVSLVVVSVLYAPIALVTWPTDPPPPSAWAALVALALLCTAIVFVVFFQLIAAIGPARATLITFVNPAVVIAVGAIVLDEQITAATIGGFVLVLAGCWLATRHGAEAARVDERAQASVTTAPTRTS